MITLNRERGFETIERWADILDMPGFDGNLDPLQHSLKQIIGNYSFKDLIPCGLSACHQPHGKGYIATTTSGLVTNLGSICGKNHFGVNFDEQSKVFDRGVRMHNNRQTVGTFIVRLDEYIAHVQGLKTAAQGASWINRHVRVLTTRDKDCPLAVVNFLAKMVSSRNSTIEVTRAATKEERAVIAAQQGKDEEDVTQPQYVSERIGALDGLPALYPENALRDLLVVGVEQNLKDLEGFDVDTANYDDLRRWAKWCGEYDYLVEQAETVIREGMKLLTRDNLGQLAAVITAPDDRTQFKKYLRTLV